MPVKIRLTRRGRKKLALYDIIVADSRSPRDGKYIEKLGTFNPNKNPVIVALDDAKALQWLLDGAQPTDTARKILSDRGIMFKKHLQIGVNKGAVTQAAADERFANWMDNKLKAASAQIDELSKKKAAAKKEKLAAEAKVNAARAEALQSKANAALAALAEAEATANASAGESTEAAADAPTE
jgi:small subunit ribosomal protein S16